MKTFRRGDLVLDRKAKRTGVVRTIILNRGIATIGWLDGTVESAVPITRLYFAKPKEPAMSEVELLKKALGR